MDPFEIHQAGGGPQALDRLLVTARIKFAGDAARA